MATPDTAADSTPDVTGDQPAPRRRLSLEWKRRLRLTVLILIFFALLGLVTGRIYVGSGAQSPEEFPDSLQRYVPVRILDK